MAMLSGIGMREFGNILKIPVWLSIILLAIIVGIVSRALIEQILKDGK